MDAGSEDAGTRANREDWGNDEGLGGEATTAGRSGERPNGAGGLGRGDWEAAGTPMGVGKGRGDWNAQGTVRGTRE